MKVYEIANLIENVAPLTLAEEWDNVGLLIGDKSCEISGVVVCLDLTNGAIDYCINNNCNMIITHHPAIFEPLKKITYCDYIGNLVAKCIKNNINVYSAHTNMDMSEEGINFEIGKLLGVQANRFLSDGLGIYGEYNGDLDKLLLNLQEITKESWPKIYIAKDGKNHKKQNIAFISGSGGRIDEVVKRVKELNIATFISSEFKHNIIIELLAQDVNVIQIGHFESEIIFVEIIFKLLENKISNLYKYVSLN